MATRLHGRAHRILLVTFLAAIFFAPAPTFAPSFFASLFPPKTLGIYRFTSACDRAFSLKKDWKFNGSVVNSNVVVTALLAGEIDVAGIAGSSMRAAARGAPLKANFFPYDKSLFVLMGAPGIKRVQDLKGKVIGTTGPGATTEVAAVHSLAESRHGPEERRDIHDHRRR